MSELFRKLKESSREGEANRSSYGFQTGSHPFRDRPGVPTTTSRSVPVTPVRHSPHPRGVATYPPKPPEPRRMPDGDRPPAYQPPAVRDDAYVVDWEPPRFSEMLKDLGLRMLEVGLAAAGQEIAYFFSKRRFFTEEQRRRRDW